MKKVVYIVNGRVQGVFFRKYTQQKALSLGLVGEARNMSDGSVSVTAYGNEQAINELERWLWKGSPMAKVNKVVQDTAIEHDANIGDVPKGFSVR